jgi:hypothetical protein
MEYDVAPVLHRIGAFYFLYNTAPNGDVRALDNGNSQIVYPGGDVSMICPDGTVLPPFDAGKSIIGLWGIAIDGNDNVWVANSTGRSIAQLCGVRAGKPMPSNWPLRMIPVSLVALLSRAAHANKFDPVAA